MSARRLNVAGINLEMRKGLRGLTAGCLRLIVGIPRELIGIRQACKAAAEDETVCDRIEEER